MTRRVKLVCAAACAALIVACGGGGGGSGGDGGSAKPGYTPPTAKAHAGLPPETNKDTWQLDDPNHPNHDPDDMNADPSGDFLFVNPFGPREPAVLVAQRYDPFIAFAPKSREDLRKWLQVRDTSNRAKLAAFEKETGILRLPPGTKVEVHNSTITEANVSIAAGQPGEGRYGFVLPGTVGRAAKLYEWRRRNGK